MIARYKGTRQQVGNINLLPGSMHSIQVKRKIFPSKYIWLVVDGVEDIPHTLESLFVLWELGKG